MFSFSLSSKNLKILEKLPTNEMFTFVTNSGRYTIPRLTAAFLSEKVFSLITEDPTVTELSLNANDDDAFFNEIIDLSYGKEITVTEKNYNSLLNFANELKNEEIINACNKFANNEEISEKTIKLTIFDLILKVSEEIEADEEINWISSNLFKIPPKYLVPLDVQTIRKILSSPNLEKRDENQFFDYVSDISSLLKQSTPMFFDLIRLDGLNDERRKLFNEKFSIKELPKTAFDQIKNADEDELEADDETPFLSYQESSDKKIGQKTRRIEGTVINLGKNPFLGVLNSFECLKENVQLHASSTSAGVIQLLGKSTNDTNFWTYSCPDSWIRIFLKTTRLIINAYSLEGRCDYNYNQMQSWVLEATNGVDWVVLDSHTEEPLVKKTPVTFTLSNTDAYKIFRIRQTGPNTYGDYDIVLSKIELFGTLINDMDLLQD